MYPSPEEVEVINAAEALMEDAMKRYDPSHDRYHVQRVRRTALAIARKLDPSSNPNLLTIELAALLHDVLDKKYVSAAEASDPYAFFLPFFESVKGHVDLISDGRAKHIARIVDNVSWSNESKLRKAGLWSEWHQSSVELHCVQDADRLDAIGAFGILRCAAYGTTTNSPLHTPTDDPLHVKSSIQHFSDKLIHIHERLKTVPGKALGKKRHETLLAFMESVDEEYSASM
ncbi:hypothetical protein SISNIDRAFT_466845 [Sistotremastrum niveocremeum HHB9708]|uniref:HD/PDEase domain-containing protein n=1 Tax=Sistotremastrum niveocremeum HHB9708 TaxID=1314777 RepID=A0A164TLC6_9AGAM|nr:hypothetical protein SISNIDRAFT_466845 [Sistotremastrum niveocremeum HHB9708]